MDFRLVATGILLMVVGGAVLAFPQTLSPPNTVYDHTTLAQIQPGNYTDVQISLSSQETLQGAISSGPGSIDFFLMNSSAFSTWTSKAHPPVYVYPESRLGVKNYTFAATGTGATDVYHLVLVSRSANASTSVLLHLLVQRQPTLLETLAIPGVLIALGLVSAGFGATRKGKAGAKG